MNLQEPDIYFLLQTTDGLNMGPAGPLNPSDGEMMDVAMNCEYFTLIFIPA